MALSTQPEEYLDTARTFSKEKLHPHPTLEEDVEDFLLGERDGDHAKAHAARRQRLLISSFCVMVVVSLFNKVTQKLQTIPMYNYPSFVNLWTTFMYIPFSFAYIFYQLRHGSAITPDQLNIPKRIFAVMGLLDGVAGIMQVFAATYLSGSMLILVTQSSIPISMLISKKLLRTKYSRSQYLGAITVAFGVLFVLGPTLNGGSGGGSTLLWSTVLVLSCVPMVLSSVYKEIALGESELDPIYLNGWVAVFQFLVSVPLAVPSALAGDPAVYPSELPANLWAGLKCYVGIDTVVGGIHADNCWPAAPSYVNMYLVFNMAYNVLIILILKYGSANLLFLAMTITVPMGQLAFGLPFIPGHTAIHATDIIGLCVIMLGLSVYRFGPEFFPQPEDDAKPSLRQPLLNLAEDERFSGADDGDTDSIATESEDPYRRSRIEIVTSSSSPPWQEAREQERDCTITSDEADV